MNDDTIKLLRECNAGVKMGISSIDDILSEVEDTKLKDMLQECRADHVKLETKTEEYLKMYHDDGKEPAMMAKTMSWMKTNVKMAMEKSDATIADLMIDGCNMGVKSLYRYLNQYPAAEDKVKNLTKDLIHSEEDLSKKLRAYL